MEPPTNPPEIQPKPDETPTNVVPIWSGPVKYRVEPERWVGFEMPGQVVPFSKSTSVSRKIKR